MTTPVQRPAEEPTRPEFAVRVATRHAFAVRLPPENRERYLELHRAVPAAIEAMIRAANIRNYSIYACGDLLFAYYEYVGSDHAADLARMADDPATQAWWLDTAPLQERLPGTPDGEQWLPLTEAWHLGDSAGPADRLDPADRRDLAQSPDRTDEAADGGPWATAVADGRRVSDMEEPK